MANELTQLQVDNVALDVPSGGGGGLTIDDVYPVGSIYMSVNNVSPASLFGGTWAQIQDTFLLSSGSTYTSGATGGSADAIVVEHNHSVDRVTIASSGVHTNHTMKGYGATLGTGSTGWRFGSAGTQTATGIIQGGAHTHDVPSHNTNDTGSDGTGANMPPYLVVNMWQRTA